MTSATRLSAPRTPRIYASTTVTSIRRNGELIDLVTVERMANSGRRVPGATEAERLAALDLLVTRRGRVWLTAARRLGLAPARVLELRPDLVAYEPTGTEAAA